MAAATAGVQGCARWWWRTTRNSKLPAVLDRAEGRRCRRCCRGPGAAGSARGARSRRSVLEPGGCIAFRIHFNSNMPTHPARGAGGPRALPRQPIGLARPGPLAVRGFHRPTTLSAPFSGLLSASQSVRRLQSLPQSVATEVVFSSVAKQRGCAPSSCFSVEQTGGGRDCAHHRLHLQLLHPPLPTSRCFNRHGEGVSASRAKCGGWKRSCSSPFVTPLAHRSTGVVAVVCVGARPVFHDSLAYHHVSIPDDGESSSRVVAVQSVAIPVAAS